MADHEDADNPVGTAAGRAAPDSVQASSLRDQIATVRQALAGSPVRRKLLLYCAGIVAVIMAIAGGQILLNRWNQPFYDALQRRDLAGFLHQLVVFAEIAGGLLFLNVAQTWLNQMIRLRLREALTLDLIDQWMRPNRAFLVAKAGAIGVNPDQRMQEDAGHLADLTTGLGVGLFQSLILLVSFVGVLWTLSSGFVFHFDGRSLAIPGYMVWAAMLYAGSASWLSWLVGRPLIQQNSEHYAREADLRFSMMRANEHIDAIALAHGEPGEKRRLQLDLATLLDAIRRIYTTQINLAWVTDTYGWITVVAPILVASPVYFAGDISFGGLMMAVGAFNQVHSSLRWFINNIGGIADWRATLMRVADFRLALVETDVLHGTEKRIEIAENENDAMTFDALEVKSADGCTRLTKPHVEIAAGEHVLFTGDPGAGKTLFFRAIAGLWPWGGGRIGLPKGEVPVLVPRTPYFAPGNLREVLGQPAGGDKPTDAELETVLTEIGLKRLSGLLDRAGWEHELNEDEQRLLALAAVAVRRPRFVVIDEVLDTLDTDTLKRVLALFSKRLEGTAILAIGRALPDRKFFHKTLTIVKDAAAPALKPPKLRAGAMEPPPSQVRGRTPTSSKLNDVV
ncbi:ABC transporter ATP-binding protein/permease [Mesorhizobium sp. A623]